LEKGAILPQATTVLTSRQRSTGPGRFGSRQVLSG
jgi:hypothetical protein